MNNHPYAINPLPFKKISTSILMSIFLGPFGLLYSHFWGALVIAIVFLPGLFIPVQVAAPALVILWLICIFWGAAATERYNKKLLTLFYSDGVNCDCDCDCGCASCSCSQPKKS